MAKKAIINKRGGPKPKVPMAGRAAMPKEGDWFPVSPTFFHTCCGCGLRHRVEIRVAYEMRWRLDDAQLPN